jgi:hypothetical protein
MVDNYPAASVWWELVPSALASGALKCKPDPEILKGGLEKLQDAVNLQKKGVSAKKLVMEIDGSVL